MSVLARDVDQLDEVRGLVPTPRELAGEDAPDYEFRPASEVEQPRFSLRDSVRGYLHQMNPREIAAGRPIAPLFLMAYLNFVVYLNVSILGVITPELKVAFGLSIAALTGMGPLLQLVAYAVAPFMGYLADRVRRTPLLAAGAVLGQLSVMFTGAAQNIPTLLGLGLAGQASRLSWETLGFPLMTDFYPPRTRGRSFAFSWFGGILATLIAPVGVGLLVANYGWRPATIGIGAVSAFFCLALFWLREPVRGYEDRLAAGVSEEAARHEQRPMRWSEAWRTAWSIRTIRLLALITPFGTVAANLNGLFTQLWYANHYHLGPAQRGLLISIAIIPVVGGILFSGVVTDRLLAYKPQRVISLMALCYVLGAAGMILLVVSPFLAIAVGFSFIVQFFVNLIEPASTTLQSLVVPARIRAQGLQVIKPFSLLGLPLPLILGIASDASGLQTGIVAVAAITVFIGLALFFGGSGIEQDIKASLAASAADEAAHRAREEGRNTQVIVRGLEIFYDGAQVLFGVDLDIEQGELIALLGTNGAGKSTLLRAIAGIQQADNGAIFFDGDDVTHLPPEDIAAEGIVMMPGGQAVFPSLTVEQNLRTAAWMYRKDSEYVRSRTAYALELFPALRDRLNVPAGNLSGGEQQMVALSQALLMRPRLLMIDELSLGLAPHVVARLLEVVREINRNGTTVIVVEQSINVALQVAQRAIYMEKGEIRFDGSVRELLTRPDVVRSVFLSNAAVANELGQVAQRRILELDDDNEQVLQVDAVTLAYGGVQVLNGVSLEVGRGEVVGLIGPNGAGKTSLFDVITGFARPDAGTVRFLGGDVTNVTPDGRARMGLARSYQNVLLFPALTVRENIAVALERHLASRSLVLAAVWSPVTRRSERRVSRRVDNLVESLGLGAYADKFLNELSTGTRRIVDIACVLATQPQLLLLDEPSSGLAQAETEQLAPLIQRIVKEAGCGLLIIEHDLGLVASVSHRLVALRLGEVMAEGTPAAVLGNQDVVDALLGGASEAVVARSVSLR